MSFIGNEPVLEVMAKRGEQNPALSAAQNTLHDLERQVVAAVSVGTGKEVSPIGPEGSKIVVFVEWFEALQHLGE